MFYKDLKQDFTIDLKEFKYEAYAAIKNNVDNADERIRDGAFVKTIRERQMKNLIKAFWRHYEPMGIPLHIEEDSTGLFTVTQVSKTASNEERMILMRDKVVDRMSIGYDVIKDDTNNQEGVRDLLELKLYEYSPVPFACNEETFITGIKSMDNFALVMRKFDSLIKDGLTAKSNNRFLDLALAPEAAKWDAVAALKRVNEWAGTGSKDIDWNKYSKAFFWIDSDDKENAEAYKLNFADIVNNELVAIPAGIKEVAIAIQKGEVGSIPEREIAGIKAHIAKYHEKMNIKAPWEKADDPMHIKEGRVLSSSNRQKIADCMAALQGILDATDNDEGKEFEGIMEMAKKMENFRNSLLK